MGRQRNWEEGLDDGIKFLRREGQNVFCEFEGFEFRVSRNYWPPKRLSEQSCLNSTEYYKHNVRKVHGNRYDLSRVTYTSDRGKVEVACRIHGIFTVQAGSLKSGTGGCRECGITARGISCRSNSLEFVEKSKKVHGELYEYGLVSYQSDSQKVNIVCKSHGSFCQAPTNHLQGSGCPKCAEDSRHGYRKSRYVDNCEKKYKGLSKLYLVSCNKYGELFYKIGITSTSVYKRFSGSRALPYNWELLHEVTATAGTIWDTEKFLHKHYKEKSYTPEIKFAGSTECFSDIDLEEFKRLCEEFKTT